MAIVGIYVRFLGCILFSLPLLLLVVLVVVVVLLLLLVGFLIHFHYPPWYGGKRIYRPRHANISHQTWKFIAG